MIGGRELIYVIGSLRHPRTREVAAALRAYCLDVVDDWHAAGPEADDIWQQYEQERGRSFREALRGRHAKMVLDFDRGWLDRCTAAVLVMPAGKSGHTELGYVLGQRKPGYILLEHEPDRWDVMYGLATNLYYHIDDLVKELTR